jgi:ubiquinone/menaquinone biosynthesis C-methylase UbiE
MFLSKRATQAEYFDSPDRTAEEIAEAYAALGKLNRATVHADPFQRLMTRFIGRKNCGSLSILDLGAGDGALGAQLTSWAKNRNWEWRFTNFDLCETALKFSKVGTNVVGSVLCLPFSDASFDVVIASQMTHHLNAREDIVKHLREAWRVARQAVFITDVHRGPIVYGMLWLLLHLQRYPEHFRHDALLSVKRGFRVGEMQQLADEAGINGARAWLYYGTRVVLQAKKIN